MNSRDDYPRAAGALAWSVLSDDRGYIVSDLLGMFREIDRLRPVVEALQEWRHASDDWPGNLGDLIAAVDTYERST